VRPDAGLAATRVDLLGRNDEVGVDIFAAVAGAARVDRHLVWESVQTRCLSGSEFVI
jgi:hypothetical protein